ncbi:MAG TPA: MaoC/PaaZ C-terminal domain-containing protein [Salinisphaeraceae bacterium]|nr:MaoC/PaaZ C-terminal domain-containing protein [Salinisphaeraceae bacterium]
MIYFEDLEPGQEQEFGPLNVTAEAIVSFAEKYDPQPFHLSDEGARGTFFGSLAASGWHTAAMTRKLITAYAEEPLASLAPVGFDDLRWRQPVYPGDELRAQTRVEAKEMPANPAAAGVVRFAVTTRNQHDQVVMSMTSIVRVASRDST